MTVLMKPALDDSGRLPPQVAEVADNKQASTDSGNHSKEKRIVPSPSGN
jgi:hypothetical protein